MPPKKQMKGGKKLPQKPSNEKKISTSGPFMTPARSQPSSMVQQTSLRQEPIKSRPLLNLNDTLGMSFNKDLGMALMSLDEKPFKLGGKKKKSK